MSGAPATTAEPSAGDHTTLLSRTHKILADTALGVWESNAGLLTFEAVQCAKLLAPQGDHPDPAAAMTASLDQWHQGTEQLVAHARRVNDLVYECGWKLFENYADGLRQVSMRFKPWPAMGCQNQPRAHDEA